jgi:hypothetical protein
MRRHVGQRRPEHSGYTEKTILHEIWYRRSGFYHRQQLRPCGGQPGSTVDIIPMEIRTYDK